jgi:transcriptional regulator GlxA family with amidase domain
LGIQDELPDSSDHVLKHGSKSAFNQDKLNRMNALLEPAKKRVLFVVIPEVHLLDLAGPAQVFDTANDFGARYELEFVGPQFRVMSAQGLKLEVQSLPVVQANDLIVIPGVRLQNQRPPDLDSGLKTWLRNASAVGASIASVCAGALVLLELGLLEGKRFTTHWSLFESVRARHPRARLQEAALFVTDGRITTSAGIASGIDMALSLVERDHGPILTAKTARELVVYLRRDGTAAQTSIYLEHRTHLHSGVHRVQDHLMQHANQKLKLEALSSIANLSPRGLTHAFKQATGLTPLEYQTRLRLELAQNLLHDPKLSLELIAERCGFEDARHLRRLWQERFGISPSQVRKGAKHETSKDSRFDRD